ncbi:MAG: ATPase P [Candidatus Syntrophonatronum acetioxidans]|uniref:ATPase P n=1 Tax=Candidatus Syntrophonatronum acetioxidans TaxID=1795816 RepID=A0A424YE71_9FIRM|nr:MAG: ATPase P [Candidatus Syntrophonatronum acetioxidans]
MKKGLFYDIPGRGVLEIRHLVLDLNGTIAFRGKIPESTCRLINELSRRVEVYILTADTRGKAHNLCSSLKARVCLIEEGREKEAKAEFVKEKGPGETIALGNGDNDQLMLETSCLGIAVLGEEGCSTASLLKADMVVKDVDNALEILLDPDTLKATLRS